jgi:hypothetical protein
MSRSSSIGSYSERTTCPHCGDRIKLEDVRIFLKPNAPLPKCPSCGTSIRVSTAYRRLIMLIAFASGWLIPYLIGLGAYIVLAWIPFWLLSVALVSNLAKVVVPPRLEDADSVTRRSVLRRNLELFISLWLYWIGILVMMALVESMKDKPAYPFGLFGLLEPAFVSRSKTTFIGISEIVLANSFIGAVCLFPLAIIFRWAFRRSHVTQLGISPSVQDQGQDDD